MRVSGLSSLVRWRILRDALQSSFRLLPDDRVGKEKLYSTAVGSFLIPKNDIEGGLFLFRFRDQTGREVPFPVLMEPHQDLAGSLAQGKEFSPIHCR